MSQIESEMLDNLMTLLMSGKDVGGIEWQARKLQSMGFLREQNLKSIKNHREELIQAVRDELEYNAFRRATMVDQAVKESGKTLAGVMKPAADPILRAQIAAWEARTLADMSKMSATLLQGAGQVFQDTVIKAAAKVQLGVSGRKAIAEVAKEWAQNGIPALVDSAGREWTTEAYAQTIIRTTANNAANDVQLARMEELGEDLVEISSHLGSRPEHADFQGRIYSVSGRSKKYPPLSVTGYGTAGGIGGVNCRHALYLYPEGTKKTFAPQPEKRNEEAYKNSQKQRYLERQVRKAKRYESLMERTGSPEEISEAKALVRGRQSAIRSFIDNTGRKRQYAREQIYE